MIPVPSDVIGLQTFIMVFVFAVSLTCSEIIRGYCAYLLGDRYGYVERRLTTNPLELIDFMGTIAFPIVSILLQFPIMMAWCHPVQIDFMRIRFGKLGVSLAILAKPVSEFILCILCLIFVQFSRPESMAIEIFTTGVYLNAILVVFSFLPILPLSGGQLVSLFLPARGRAIYEQHAPYSFPIFLILFIFAPMVGLPIMKFFMFCTERVILAALFLLRLFV